MQADDCVPLFGCVPAAKEYHGAMTKTRALALIALAGAFSVSAAMAQDKAAQPAPKAADKQVIKKPHKPKIVRKRHKPVVKSVPEKK
jgi:hypothetical protein